MGKIQLPPGGGGANKLKSVFHVCVSSDGKDFLDLTIKDPGYCLHAPDGSFKPELPSGPVCPHGPLNLYPTVRSGKAYLAYSDTTSGNTYVFVITIQEAECPGGNEDSEE
jgi:hypothetical protein